MSHELAKKIKAEARRQGFALAGITSLKPPPHISAYEKWLDAGRHAAMGYLDSDRARAHRADPQLILPQAKSIISLAAPYANPQLATAQDTSRGGRISSYAWEDDYHLTLKPKLENIVKFIEKEVGQAVPNRWYTDTGPILERDLAQRAGLGWIGKNTCLINPKIGSHFFLAEIFLALQLPPDEPFAKDHCGSCTRCIDACPTQALLPNRTLDANRCISYLTIENKGEIPEELRPKLGSWVFGCDICQSVCPWNGKKAIGQSGNRKIGQQDNENIVQLRKELTLTPQEFNKKFKNSPVKRAKRRGYLRNIAVALGNAGNPAALPMLEAATKDEEALIRIHAGWAIEKLKGEKMPKLLLASQNPGKLREMRAILQDLPIQIISPADLNLQIHVEEIGKTYAENAALKAKSYAKAGGLPALGDDSGLEVDVLGGAPGLYSARYAPDPKATDGDRRSYLLANLRAHPRPWTARFRAAIAIALPNGEVFFSEGVCEGEIIPEERGTGGFGYDPVFYIAEEGCTMAELDEDEKNRISHRARALAEAKKYLATRVKS